MAPPLVVRGAAVVQDLRLLGLGAPVRAGLEVSKRFGGHALVFGRLARQAEAQSGSARRPPTFVAPFRAPDRSLIGDDASARTLRDAARILGGTIELFGQAVDLGPEPDWHGAVDGPERWPRAPWWEIDIRSSARLGDVKWVWELGRHRHLVVLARAAFLDPDEARWLEGLDAQLRSWMEANPPEIGIHWYSNLEVALRAIAWCEIIALVGPRLPVDTREAMVGALHHSGRHLLADLAYTVSTMRNNHLLGDALGLTVLGHAFTEDDRARRWRQVGERLFEQQLARQVHADGSQIEDSLSYHRFVLEMLVTRLRLGGASPDARRATRATAALLVRLGVLEGPVPRYGDGDEGRVLISSGPFDDLRGSTRVGLAHGASTTDPDAAPDDQAPPPDELVWYGPVVPTGAPPTPVGATTALAAERDGRPIGGGLARARRGDLTAWLKAGGDTSHGHADLCSTPLVLAPAGLPDRGDGGAWLIGDPGTGTYNGPAAQRDYFRSSLAHSVLRLGGLDQLEPYRAFRWRHEPVGGVGEPVADDDTVVMWGWHGSYRRLDPARRIVRAVVLDRAGATMIDWVEGPAGIDYALSLPLAPGAHLDVDTGHLVLRGGSHRVRFPGAPARVQVRTMCGADPPFDGWWSAAYGSHEPAERVEITGAVDGPLIWQVLVGDEATGAPQADGTAVTITRRAEGAEGATIRLDLDFRDDRVVLDVAGPLVDVATGTPRRTRRELVTPS